MAVKSIKGGYCHENSSRALAIVYIPYTQKDIRDKKGKENEKEMINCEKDTD
jgi:hypothetical protein